MSLHLLGTNAKLRSQASVPNVSDSLANDAVIRERVVAVVQALRQRTVSRASTCVGFTTFDRTLTEFGIVAGSPACDEILIFVQFVPIDPAQRSNNVPLEETHSLVDCALLFQRYTDSAGGTASSASASASAASASPSRPQSAIQRPFSGPSIFAQYDARELRQAAIKRRHEIEEKYRRSLVISREQLISTLWSQLDSGQISSEQFLSRVSHAGLPTDAPIQRLLKTRAEGGLLHLRDVFRAFLQVDDFDQPSFAGFLSPTKADSISRPVSARHSAQEAGAKSWEWWWKSSAAESPDAQAAAIAAEAIKYANPPPSAADNERSSGDDGSGTGPDSGTGDNENRRNAIMEYTRQYCCGMITSTDFLLALERHRFSLTPNIHLQLRRREADGNASFRDLMKEIELQLRVSDSRNLSGINPFSAESFAGGNLANASPGSAPPGSGSPARASASSPENSSVKALRLRSILSAKVGQNSPAHYESRSDSPTASAHHHRDSPARAQLSHGNIVTWTSSPSTLELEDPNRRVWNPSSIDDPSSSSSSPFRPPMSARASSASSFVDQNLIHHNVLNPAASGSACDLWDPQDRARRGLKGGLSPAKSLDQADILTWRSPPTAAEAGPDAIVPMANTPHNARRHFRDQTKSTIFG